MKIQVEYSVRSQVRDFQRDLDWEEIVLELKKGNLSAAALPTLLDERSKIPLAVHFMEDDGSHIDTVLL